jgi:phage RecT family recombinase
MVLAALTTTNNVKKFEAALAGTGVTPARFLRQAQTAFMAVPALAKCDPYSVLGAMLGAAQMGLELEPALEEADIIPYGGEAKLMPRYGGLMKLVRQGEVTEVYADTVHELDGFKYDRGSSKRIEHVVDYKLSEEQRGDVVGFYAVARLARGGVECHYMHRLDVEKIRDVVKEKTRPEKWVYSPWNGHFAKMGEKTVLRALCKRLPKSDRAARVVQLTAMAEAGEPLTIAPEGFEIHDATPRAAKSDRPATLDDVAAKLTEKIEPKAAAAPAPAGDMPDPNSEEGKRLSRELDAQAAKGAKS